VKKNSYKNILILSIIALILMSSTSLIFGQQKISISSIIRVILGQENDGIDYVIIKKIRLPRIIASLLVGAALSISGAVLQGIFNNPLASPYLLGISNGAGFAASAAIIMGINGILFQIISFSGGILAAFLALIFSYFFKNKGVISIIIGGILIGNFFAALTMYVKLVADPLAKLPSIVYWLMGSFIGVTEKTIIFPLILILLSILLLLLLSWKLTILSYGDLHARTLGENPVILKFIALILTTLATSSAISMSGIIGWIGVIIPQLARISVGADFRRLMPLTILWGAGFTCLIDSIARSFLSYELPVGLISSIIGLVFSVIILSKKTEKIL